ncbi:MAG: hypothetical protein K0M60_18685 [Hydrogenophaga sp.]|nr:hypothetical protein [Hydrogenophaga sp.]
MTFSTLTPLEWAIIDHIDNVPRDGVAPAIAVLSGSGRERISLPQRAG